MKNRAEQIKEAIQDSSAKIVIIYTNDPEALAAGTPISDDEVKKYKNDFKPVFKDKILFELTLNSIITFNLAKIIYICFIILKSFNKNRR